MPAEAHSQAGPWRENVEALTMAIIMAILLKGFIVEAYRIPTGSMQPTLMGDETTGVFDRILVDKLSYQFREPERFDIVVFRYPLDHSKNFVKRLVGLPGEHFRIHAGDLWRRDAVDEEWEILRRPRDVQESTWKELRTRTATPWTPLAAGWEAEPLRARGSGRARWGEPNAFVLDHYNDGYPESLRERIRSRFGRSAEYPVGDLRVAGQVTALPGCRSVSVELGEGRRRYSLRIPGPAAPEGSAPEILVDGREPDGELLVERAQSPNAYRLPAAPTAFAAQNLDDLLELFVDGALVCSLEIPEARDSSGTIHLAVDGEGADFEDLRVFRDIYYLATQTAEIFIPEGRYFMLGDNTQDSSDSREWTFARYEVTETLPDGAERTRVIRGGHRQGENPRRGFDPELLWFDDQWGEPHHFEIRSAEKLPPEREPFVTRDLILGRALATFWPIYPHRDLYRLRFVH